MCNLDDLFLNVRKGVEGDVSQLVLDTVFFETKTATSKEHIGLTGGRQVGDTVTNEDDHGNGAVFAVEAGLVLVVVERLLLVVTELVVVQPDRLPCRTVF